MNNQRLFNPSHAYYKPVGNQSCSLQLSSYDEPKVTQSGGAIQREFVGTTGFGLSLEIALPKFVVGKVTKYTGVGMDLDYMLRQKVRKNLVLPYLPKLRLLRL